jgi:DNA-binding transcriptional LysR family regulator
MACNPIAAFCQSDPMMMPTNIPIELLRTLVAITETGSMVRATERVRRTQSALSQQMKRLEELVQTTLFRREGRQLLLTPAGEVLLNHAREILRINDRAMAALFDSSLTGPARIGIVQDFAETALVGVLARFAHINPDVRIHVSVGHSQELKDMVDADKLDMALCLVDPMDVHAVAAADMVWLGNASLASERIMPLAMLSSPCLCRESALEAIERAGIGYRMVIETSNLAVVMSAVRAGLAITCRPNAYLATGMTELSLPHIPLPKVGYALHVRSPSHRSIERLMAIFKRAAQDLLPA